MSAQTNTALNTRSWCYAELRHIVGQDNIRQASGADAVDGVQPAYVVVPRTYEEVSEVLKTIGEAGLSAAPRGGGTKLGWGNPPKSADIVISTSRLDKVLEHAWKDLTCTVEAGCTIGRLDRELAKHGQRVAIDVLHPERATVGGILATNDSGSLRIRFGGLRDLIIGATIVLPNGTIARCGGKVVKNVAGFDLMKLTTGAYGTLGLIVNATFRLHPLPRAEQTISFQFDEESAAANFLLKVCNSNLVPTGVQARSGRETAFLVDLRFEGTDEGIEMQVRRAAAIASDRRAIDADREVWQARQHLWTGAENADLVKISFLPSEFGLIASVIRELCSRQECDWEMVAQGHGLAWLRVTGTPERAAELLAQVRTRLEKGKGSLVLLDCRRELKDRVDVWGDAGDSHNLARRVKRQFDPHSTLNPGRFVGGI